MSHLNDFEIKILEVKLILVSKIKKCQSRFQQFYLCPSNTAFVSYIGFGLLLTIYWAFFLTRTLTLLMLFSVFWTYLRFFWCSLHNTYLILSTNQIWNNYLLTCKLQYFPTLFKHFINQLVQYLRIQSYSKILIPIFNSACILYVRPL